MNFFDGLFFSLGGSVPRCTATEHNYPRYYGLQFNYRGPLHLQINSAHDFQVDGPYAFLTYPGTYFTYGAVGNIPRHHNFICTYGSKIKDYIDSGLFVKNSETPLVRISSPEKFLHTMQTLIAMIRQPGAIPPRAVFLFEDLLLQMYESAQSIGQPPLWQSKIFQDIIEKIYQEPEKDWDFGRLAEENHITLTHFRRQFKKLAGMPPQQFLISSRLQKAADLLISTLDSIKEISWQAGFDNMFYFSRLFRNRYLVSPSDYRREFRPSK